MTTQTVQYWPVDKTEHGTQQQQQQPQHRSSLALTLPSEDCSVPRPVAGHGLADLVGMPSDEAEWPGWVDHTAADACSPASRHHKVMTMMTPEQACDTYTKQNVEWMSNALLMPHGVWWVRLDTSWCNRTRQANSSNSRCLNNTWTNSDTMSGWNNTWCQ